MYSAARKTSLISFEVYEKHNWGKHEKIDIEFESISIESVLEKPDDEHRALSHSIFLL